jgi:AmmeMemoRadiSam system protein A
MSILGAFIFPHPPLIIPAIGNGNETFIQSTIDACLDCAKQIASLKPDTIVLTSPHCVSYQDYFHISPGTNATGDFSNFQAADVKLTANYDPAFVDALTKTAKQNNIPAGSLGEKDPALDHGTMIPLYFINQQYCDYKLVRIGLSGLSSTKHYQMGKCIQNTAAELDRRVVFVASGDLSHKLLAEGPYGFHPAGPEFDQLVTSAMATGDFLKFLQLPNTVVEQASECGLKSFQIMAGCFDQYDVDSTLLSYEGPFGVGYGVASFYPQKENPSRDLLRLDRESCPESLYVKLARYTVEEFIQNQTVSKYPDPLPDNFYDNQAGVFVSLKTNGNLRGCIGTILPTTSSIMEEIQHNAIRAATRDPRFDPVEITELASLEYSVDVLTEPEAIDHPDQLDVKKYGVIVEQGTKRGLLLPDLDGVDTVAEQLQIAKQKGDIHDDADTPVSLFRFEVVRYR